MAQTTRSRSTTKGSTGRSDPKASKKSGAAKRSTSKGGSANGSQAKSTTQPRSKSQSRSRPKSRSAGQSRNGAGSFTDTVVDGTKAGGRAVADVASKARVPLIAGGTAIVGAAAGVVLKDRLGASKSTNPLKRLGGMSLPKSAAKLDLDTVKSAAERVSAYGQQASDIAGAIEKTRKKNK
jgi:hypothetical protein